MAAAGVLQRLCVSTTSSSSRAERIISHEFLPSSSVAAPRRCCTWRARAAVQVQFREPSSEALIEPEFPSPSGGYGDRSMAHYAETISALQETKLGHETVGSRFTRDAVPPTKSKSKHVSENSKYKTIKLVKSIETLPLNSVHSLLSKSELQFTTREASFLLNGIHSHEKALAAFDWLCTNRKLTRNVYAYNIILKILGSRQEWSRIDALLSQMEEDDCKPDDYTFNTIIMSASKASYVSYATKSFKLMLQKGVQPTKLTYSMMMLLYQRKGYVEDAEDVYTHMVESGVHAVTAYSAMIALYTRSGMFVKSEQVMKVMKSNEVAPDRDNWLKQLNTYGQQGKIEGAEAVMETITSLGLSLGIVGYNSMITAYGKAALYDKAAALFERMKSEGLEPDEVTYSCMTGACGRVGKLKEALRFFEEMKKLGIKPTSSNFCTMISLYGKAGNFAGIIRVISDMKKLGVKPDWHTLDSVVRAYDRAGQTNKVLQAITLLRNVGWVEEPRSYGTLLHVYLKCNLQHEALRIFFAMRKHNTAPKEYMCRSLICACKDAGMFEDAHAVFEEMQVAGVVPSLESSCTMINVYGLNGDVKAAEGLFESLRSSVQNLDIIVYNVMINVYMRFEMHEEALRLYSSMEEDDQLLPDSYTFHSMLRICQKCNLQEQAEEIYWRLRNSGVELDEVMCNCVLNTCARFLPLEEVHKVFQEMMALGYIPNNITFNVMIDLYGKAGMLERARKALKAAQHLGLADKISFSTLIDAYGKKQDFPNMEATLWEMQNAGHGGSSEAFNSILDAYGKAGHLEKLDDVLARMQKSGFRMDLETYNILINIYGRCAMFEKMEALFHKMQEEGFKPDRWTYNTMIRTYGYADYPERAVCMFKEMQDAQIKPDRITYIVLVAAYEKSGNLFEAARWSLWMNQAGYSK